MKTKMKKLLSIKGILLLALALPVALGAVLAAGLEPISISGEVNLGTFSGTATVTVGDCEVSGAVQVVPLQDPIPKDGGLHFPVVEHRFTLDNGSLVTTGEEFAMPTDENPAVYTLHGNMEIIEGTGVFEGASGELRVNGQMDWSVGQATFESHGTISR